ncbi:MAG: PH domain-containing protein [Planctomycetota bacterium]
MPEDDVILQRAEFDPRLVTYFHLQILTPLVLGVFTIPIAILWGIFGRAFHRRQYERLSCALTPRGLVLRRGVLVRVQKSVPLDKITDLALSEGPLLRALGLCSLTVETAGGGQTTNTGQAILPGVANAEAFRDAVIAQRDAIVGAPSAAVPAAAGLEASDARTLDEIRDAVLRIEKLLEQRG